VATAASPSGRAPQLVQGGGDRLAQRRRGVDAVAVDARQVADELAGFNFDRARAATEQIFVTTAKILAIAEADGVPPSVAADRLAERRMADVGRLRGIWLGTMGSA